MHPLRRGNFRDLPRRRAGSLIGSGTTPPAAADYYVGPDARKHTASTELNVHNRGCFTADRYETR